MADDVLLNKAQSIERAIKRVREEYANADGHFADSYTHQDAAILNIQRACEACFDMGQHLIHRDKLGIPQSTRDIFTLLAEAKYIESALANELQKMVGFRNIAVHEYQKLQLPILEAIIKKHLEALLTFSQILLKQHA